MTSAALPDTPGTNSDCGVLIRASCGLCLYWRCHQKIVLGAWRNLSPHRTEQVLRNDRWNTSGNLASLASLATEGSYRNAGGACSAPSKWLSEPSSMRDSTRGLYQRSVIGVWWSCAVACNLYHLLFQDNVAFPHMSESPLFRRHRPGSPTLLCPPVPQPVQRSKRCNTVVQPQLPLGSIPPSSNSCSPVCLLFLSTCFVACQALVINYHHVWLALNQRFSLSFLVLLSSSW